MENYNLSHVVNSGQLGRAGWAAAGARGSLVCSCGEIKLAPLQACQWTHFDLSFPCRCESENCVKTVTFCRILKNIEAASKRYLVTKIDSVNVPHDFNLPFPFLSNKEEVG